MDEALEILLNNKHPFLCFLHGDLGVGKTTFVRHYMRKNNFSGLVKSPSYTLIEQYDEQKVLHLDLYRIQEANKALLDELGVTDLLGSYSIFVEWPERIITNLLTPDIELFLSIQDGDRCYDIKN